MLLKVISFNVRNCNDPISGSVIERAPRIKKVTAPYDADVIGLQEYTHNWEESVKELFLSEYEIYNQYRCEGPFYEGTPILWKRDKFDLLNKGCFWLSDTPSVMSKGYDSLGYHRICLFVTLKDKTSGKVFTFMNTHFGFGDDEQVKSAKLIKKYANEISSAPTFITGDFNMQPNSLGYQEFVKDMGDANALTVNDRRVTYHGYYTKDAKPEHIDYCFIDKSVKPVNFKIIDELDDGKYPSDHYGLYVELDV